MSLPRGGNYSSVCYPCTVTPLCELRCSCLSYYLATSTNGTETSSLELASCPQGLQVQPAAVQIQQGLVRSYKLACGGGSSGRSSGGSNGGNSSLATTASASPPGPAPAAATAADASVPTTVLAPAAATGTGKNPDTVAAALKTDLTSAAADHDCLVSGSYLACDLNTRGFLQRHYADRMPEMAEFASRMRYCFLGSQRVSLDWALMDSNATGSGSTGGSGGINGFVSAAVTAAATEVNNLLGGRSANATISRIRATLTTTATTAAGVSSNSSQFGGMSLELLLLDLATSASTKGLFAEADLLQTVNQTTVPKCPTGCGYTFLDMLFQENGTWVNGTGLTKPLALGSNQTRFCHSARWRGLEDILSAVGNITNLDLARYNATSSASSILNSFYRTTTTANNGTSNGTTNATAVTTTPVPGCEFQVLGCFPQSYHTELLAKYFLGGDGLGFSLSALGDWVARAAQAPPNYLPLRFEVRAKSARAAVATNSSPEALAGASLAAGVNVSAVWVAQGHNLKDMLINQMLLESQALDTIQTAAFDFAQALIDNGFVDGFKQSEIGSFIRQAATAAELCGSLSDRLDICNATSDALVAAQDVAMRTQCNGSLVLQEFTKCCAVPVLDYRGRGLVGVLPASFVASPLTIFADNPGLCGLIRQQAQADTKYVLQNSNVRLALMDLSSGDQTFILKLIHGSLGTDVKAYNLQGPIRNGDAVKVCALLERASVRVIDVAGKKCKTSLFTAASGATDEDCLQSTLLDLGFFAASLRIDEYNGFIRAYDSGLMCLDEGKAFRAWVASITWGASMGTMVFLCIIGLMVYIWLWRPLNSDAEARSSGGSSTGRGVLSGLKVPVHWRTVLSVLRFIMQLVVFIYAEATDWLFISEIAAYGNVHATFVVGWLHFVKNGILLYYLVAAYILNKEHTYSESIVATVGFIGCVFAFLHFISIWVVIAATSRMGQLGLLESNAFSPELALQGRNMFLLTSLPSMITTFVLHVRTELGTLGYGNRSSKSKNGNDLPNVVTTSPTPYGGSSWLHWFKAPKEVNPKERDEVRKRFCWRQVVVIEFLLEDLAQSIAQTVMWKSGSALAATTVIVMSIVGSAASIVWTLFNIVVLDNLDSWFINKIHPAQGDNGQPATQGPPGSHPGENAAA